MTKNSQQTEDQENTEATNEPEEAASNDAPETSETAEAVDSTGNETDPSPGGELGEVLRKLDEATAEVTEQKERYLRTVADLENYRKRAVREKVEARRQANVGLIEDLLPVLDNFKLGLKSAEKHEGGAVYAEGFRMVCKQLEEALRQNGLEEINPDNAVFDPNFHEAVAHIPHEEVEDGHIVEVHRIGYKLHERLIRPAAVVISSGPAEDSNLDSE